MPIDTILKAIVESDHDRNLGFLSIEIWGEVLDHYARPLPVPVYPVVSCCRDVMAQPEDFLPELPGDPQ